MTVDDDPGARGWIAEDPSVQNETLVHRGRKDDPLFRARRLLTMADERHSVEGRDKLLGLLNVGDLRGEVRTTWHAKEVVRSIYEHRGEGAAGLGVPQWAYWLLIAALVGMIVGPLVD